MDTGRGQRQRPGPDTGGSVTAGRGSGTVQLVPAPEKDPAMLRTHLAQAAAVSAATSTTAWE
ncbi:hypothetical protein [Streptomyces sp. NRRL S-87]|uniref:hypothetical protein n=1 Tax=Streptomyces sp. NRRL S-87 TaxID=1463920 RepID=UPI0004C28B33|nr:hypothetical protein [Streptomyces sp. NRRL S-87]